MTTSTTTSYATERDLTYAGMDATMKLAIDNERNRLRFGAVGMCDRVLESLSTCVRNGVDRLD